jgi:hypothetical protein
MAILRPSVLRFPGGAVSNDVGIWGSAERLALSSGRFSLAWTSVLTMTAALAKHRGSERRISGWNRLLQRHSSAARSASFAALSCETTFRWHVFGRELAVIIIPWTTPIEFNPRPGAQPFARSERVRESPR